MAIRWLIYNPLVFRIITNIKFWHNKQRSRLQLPDRTSMKLSTLSRLCDCKKVRRQFICALAHEKRVAYARLCSWESIWGVHLCAYSCKKCWVCAWACTRAFAKHSIHVKQSTRNTTTRSRMPILQPCFTHMNTKFNCLCTPITLEYTYQVIYIHATLA